MIVGNYKLIVMEIEKCNLMVYVKVKENKNFKALQSLKEFTFAPNLMYVCLIPYNKIDNLKKWADNYKDICKQEEVIIEIRSTYKNKCLYRIN